MARLDWYIRAGLKPRHLQLLVALDDYRRISKVAALLSVSQPAVSKTLSELELGLGLKLFERSPRGLTPTNYGDCLIRCSRVLLKELAETGDVLHAMTHGVAGKVRVGSLPAASASLLPTCLIELKKRSPATPVFVRESTMDVLLHELRAGDIELIVGTLPSRKTSMDLDEEVLFEDQTTVVVRAGHPLARRKALNWPELGSYAWILPPADSLLRDSLSNWFEASGMLLPTNAIETLSVSVIRGYLANSDAIATLPSSISTELHRQKLVAVLPLVPPPLVRPLGMTWSLDRPLSPSTRLFMDCMRTVAQGH